MAASSSAHNTFLTEEETAVSKQHGPVDVEIESQSVEDTIKAR
jgi:hypothetical protein